MVLTVEREQRLLDHQLIRAMFHARKQVFVDLLKWEVPVLDGQFELDQFDDEHAAYLIVAGPAGEHLGSARLLQTVRPHILDTLFPDLCESAPPRGADILEVTRFCLDRNQNAQQRIVTRNRLVGALVDHALAKGVARYIGVAQLGWLQQILAFGWRCRPLGLPRSCERKMIGAFAVAIDEETPKLLRLNGIHAEERSSRQDELEFA